MRLPFLSYRLSIILAFALLVFTKTTSLAQLTPGFTANEYHDVLRVMAQNYDSLSNANGIFAPDTYTRLYRSPITGLDNRWELWMRSDTVAVVSIRGTTAKGVSWLENLYAAQIPAKGSLILADKDTFTYNLGSHPQAAVHVGWLLGTAFITKDLLPKLDSLQKAGVRELIVCGHSQGGALAILLTSYLRAQLSKRLSGDWKIKTYASAAPKPGNTYYAYEYEVQTYGGWGFTVVNAADWVPEFPISMQTVRDLNATNPFVKFKEGIKSRPFVQRKMLKRAYKRMTRPLNKSQKRFSNYLGNYAGKAVVKALPTFITPTYVQSMHYARAGQPIVFMPGSDYYLAYPYKSEKIFEHHFFASYLLLARQLPDFKE